MFGQLFKILPWRLVVTAAVGCWLGMEILTFKKVISQTAYQDEERLSASISFSSQPLATIQTVQEPVFYFTNQVRNGKFDQGLSFWQWRGKAQVVGAENEVLAAPEELMLKLSETDDANLRTDNCVWQTISNRQPLAILAFKYWLQTSESVSFFDQLALTVTINDQPVFGAAAHNSIAWQPAVINLRSFIQDPQLKIEICAGNDGDHWQASWAYLDDLRSDLIVMDRQQSILITPLIDQLMIEYQLANELVQKKISQPLLINLAVFPSANGRQIDLIIKESETAAGWEIPIWLDQQPPQITAIPGDFWQDGQVTNWWVGEVSDDLPFKQIPYFQFCPQFSSDPAPDWESSVCQFGSALNCYPLADFNNSGSSWCQLAVEAEMTPLPVNWFYRVQDASGQWSTAEPVSESE